MQVKALASEPSDDSRTRLGVHGRRTIPQKSLREVYTETQKAHMYVNYS